MKRHLLAATALLALCGISPILTAAPTPAVANTEANASVITQPKETTWLGCRRIHMKVAGHNAWMTRPKQAAPGNPWLWRARFPGYHNEPDAELLKRGFAIAYVDTADLFGGPEAMRIWDIFYKHLTSAYQLNPRAALYGVSRGGLFIYGFATRWPERVATVYGDTPVMNFASWPSGHNGQGQYSAPHWTMLKKCYGFASDEEAFDSDRMPLRRADILAQAHLPLLHIVGPTDKIVPPDFNTSPFAESFRNLGGEMQIIISGGPFPPAMKGHHFPLKKNEITAAADFIEQNTPLPDLAPEVMKPWIDSPETLKPALERIAQKKEARVLYLGGSITQNPGWQNMTSASLARRYPKVKFTFSNIGIASLDSRSHAFRWRTHSQGAAPDLIFFEAAVNDAQNIGTTPEGEATIRKAYEGTIRALRTAYPKAGLVLLHFVQPSFLPDLKQGKLPRITQIHEAIGKHYSLPQIYLNREVSDRLEAGQFTWQKDFKNLHPSPFGQRLYYNAVRRLLNAALDAPNGRELTLPAPLTKDCWDTATYIPGANAYNLTQTEKVANWISPVEPRRFYSHCPALVAKGNGASFSMDFNGPLMGLYVIAGPRSAPVEWSVDGSEWKILKTSTPWSKHIAMPWPYILTESLSKGKHTAKFRVKTDGNHDTLVLYALMALDGNTKESRSL